ncbi:MAG: hypothetical protein M0Z70_12900 [Nitrospiraceae bacterium]|nr:hypothetical protein [Nitrospirota bacterium]MDA8340190.1 hypothetical protein [Nitrospiraceae bacterium]
MKTLLSIIAAFALVVAFSMPAMADSATNNDNSAVAQNHSGALRTGNLSNIANDNRTYDDDNNAVAFAYLGQVNGIWDVDNELIDGDSGDIKLDNSINQFSGIANVNLNTGAMNNQAIQNTIAVSVKSGSNQIGN